MLSSSLLSGWLHNSSISVEQMVHMPDAATLPGECTNCMIQILHQQLVKFSAFMVHESSSLFSNLPLDFIRGQFNSVHIATPCSLRFVLILPVYYA